MSSKRQISVVSVLERIRNEDDLRSPRSEKAAEDLNDIFAHPHIYPTAIQDLRVWFKENGQSWLDDRRPALALAINASVKYAKFQEAKDEETLKEIRTFLGDCICHPNVHPDVADDACYRIRFFRLADPAERKRVWEGMRPWLDRWLARPVMTPLEATCLLREPDLEQSFWLHGDGVIRSLGRLPAALRQMSERDFGHHVSPEKHDFAFWIDDTIGDIDLAQKLRAVRNREEIARIVDERVVQLKRCLNAVAEFDRAMRVLPSVTAVAGNLAVDWLVNQLKNGTDQAAMAVILAISQWDHRSNDPPDRHAFAALEDDITSRLSKAWTCEAPAEIAKLNLMAVDAFPAWCVEALINLAQQADQIEKIAPHVARAFCKPDPASGPWVAQVIAVLVRQYGKDVLCKLAKGFEGNRKEQYEIFCKSVLDSPYLTQTT